MNICPVVKELAGIHDADPLLRYTKRCTVSNCAQTARQYSNK